MIVADKIEFVRVVSADGDPLAGFSDPVPSHWIGTDLLPEGAKRAPKHRQDQDADGDDTEALRARVAELEGENADLREQLAKVQGGDTQGEAAPAGNGSLEDWQKYARTQGATDADLDGQSRDDLRKKYAPQG